MREKNVSFAIIHAAFLQNMYRWYPYIYVYLNARIYFTRSRQTLTKIIIIIITYMTFNVLHARFNVA